MKLICNTEALTTACTNIQRCVPAKAVMPHLEGILIKTVGTSAIELSGYDLDIGTVTDIPVKVEEGGAVVLNAKTLVDILRHIPEDTVVFDCNPKMVCTIKSGDVEYTLVSLNPDDYPELPSVTEEVPFTISQRVLKDMIRQTIFAVSIDDSKSVHRGIKFEIEAGEIKLVALDGYRLAIRNEFCDYNGKPLSFVVPAKTLAEVIKFMNDDEAFVKITIGRRHIIFNMNGYSLISRLLEGEFLDYNNAVPKAKTTTVRVKTKSLTECIERASIIITEKTKCPIRFIIDEDEIRISATTALGSASDKIKASIDGKRVEIGFNNRFLIDALRSCETDEVLIDLNGSLAPAIILPTDGNNFLYLILPVRIKGG